MQGLEKSYQELRVPRGVDIDVARGSFFFALLGSNGAGKTTLTAEQTYSAGEINLGGAMHDDLALDVLDAIVVESDPRAQLLLDLLCERCWAGPTRLATRRAPFHTTTGDLYCTLTTTSVDDEPSASVAGQRHH